MHVHEFHLGKVQASHLLNYKLQPLFTYHHNFKINTSTIWNKSWILTVSIDQNTREPCGKILSSNHYEFHIVLVDFSTLTASSFFMWVPVPTAEPSSLPSCGISFEMTSLFSSYLDFSSSTDLFDDADPMPTDNRCSFFLWARNLGSQHTEMQCSDWEFTKR